MKQNARGNAPCDVPFTAVGQSRVRPRERPMLSGKRKPIDASRLLGHRYYFPPVWDPGDIPTLKHRLVRCINLSVCA